MENDEGGDEPALYLGCFYKGHIEGDEQSAVAVSLCHGMVGKHYQSFNKNFKNFLLICTKAK